VTGGVLSTKRNDDRLRALLARSAAGRCRDARRRSERYGEVALAFLRPLDGRDVTACRRSRECRDLSARSIR